MAERLRLISMVSLLIVNILFIFHMDVWPCIRIKSRPGDLEPKEVRGCMGYC